MTSRAEAARATGALLLTGALAFLGTGLHPAWPLAWLAPVPALLYAYRASAAAAGGVAFGGWLLGGLNMVDYYLKAYHVPIVQVVAISVVFALIFAVMVLFSRVFVRRGMPWRAALAFPGAWVAFEMMTSRASPHGTLWNYAYTQVEVLPLIQVASVAGLAGVSFVVTFAASSVAVSLRERRPVLSIPALALAVAVVIAGALRLARPENPGTPVRVGLASWDRQPLFPEGVEDLHPLIEAYEEVVERLARSGATVIVLPELVGRVAQGDSARIVARFASAARRAGATVVVGVNRLMEGEEANEALIFSPGDSAPAVYDKQHHVPGLEDHYRRGTSLAVLEGSSRPWGVQICKDMDFPALSSAYAARGVGLLLVPSWDKVSDGWLHSRMAVMRGVEFGLAVARSAKQGALTVSNARGEIAAEARSEEAAMVSVLADVHVTANATVYQRVGDLFGWLVAAACVLLFGSLRRGPRT